MNGPDLARKACRKDSVARAVSKVRDAALPFGFPRVKKGRR